MKNQILRGVSTFYIVFPSFLFLIGWLKLPFAIPGILILVFFTVEIIYEQIRFIPQWKVLKQNAFAGISRHVLLILFILFIWMMFSGVGGAGFQNDDYRANNALLKDLIVNNWPLQFNVNNTNVHLVYYIAYYLPAALVGKMFGWNAANGFQFIWTFIGVALAFAWFWKLSRIESKNRVRKLGLFTAIFCLAGGLDYVGYYMVKGNIFALSTRVEWWAEQFQYSSNTTLLYWAPQHIIVSWILISMVADALYEPQDLKYLGLAISGAIIWSPFGVVGAAPFILLLPLVYLQRKHRKYIFNFRSIIFNGLSMGIALIYLLYIGSSQFKIPKGFIWQFSSNHTKLTANLTAFWFLEFALLACLVLLFIVFGVSFARSHKPILSWKDRIDSLEREFHISPVQFNLFILSLVLLVLFPLFKMGVYNAFVMRASIPALFVFWAFIAKIVLDASVRVKLKFNMLYIFIVMTVIIGFFPSIAEVAHSARVYHLGPPSFEEIPSSMEVNGSELVLERMGNEESFFFRFLGK